LKKQIHQDVYYRITETQMYVYKYMIICYIL